MASKIFVDINIWLDFFLKRQEYDDAEKIVELMVHGEIDVYISVSVFQTLSFYLQKDRGISASKKLLLQLLNDVKLIETNKSLLQQALTSTMNNIEDAVHYFTALSYQMDYIITNDIGFQKAALPILPVISVKEFFNEIFDV